MIYVNDTKHLEDLIDRIKELKEISDVVRFDSEVEFLGKGK